MNYLSLCQMVSSQSGTVSGDAQPTTTVRQSGRLLKIVGWTSTAWKDLQNLHNDWLWMWSEWTGPVTAGAPRYTPASWNIARFGHWITKAETVTIYDTALGPIDEGCLRFIEWEEYRRRYTRGVQVAGRPREYSISPADEFCFGPIPDKSYTAKGEFQKNAQILGSTNDPDNEVPELPDSGLHTVIAWKALILLGQYDEGAWPVTTATTRCTDDLRSMQKYRPKVSIGYGCGASIA